VLDDTPFLPFTASSSSGSSDRGLDETDGLLSGLRWPFVSMVAPAGVGVFVSFFFAGDITTEFLTLSQ
jgi:hypothetical protein